MNVVAIVLLDHVAVKMLAVLEVVHDAGWLHQDIKPANIVTAGKDEEDVSSLYLIDFGCARRYRDEYGNHLEFMVGVGAAGTRRYMSINQHDMNRTSRRDDLEQLAYTLVDLANGTLPWSHINKHRYGRKKSNRMLRDSKMGTPPQVLCTGLPQQFTEFLQYVRDLAFTDAPNYSHWIIEFNRISKPFRVRQRE